jgi:hypothetical protein
VLIKAQTEQALELFESCDSDDNFAFIAGYRHSLLNSIPPTGQIQMRLVYR